MSEAFLVTIVTVVLVTEFREKDREKEESGKKQQAKKHQLKQFDGDIWGRRGRKTPMTKGNGGRRMRGGFND